jgi:alpha-amylase
MKILTGLLAFVLAFQPIQALALNEPEGQGLQSASVKPESSSVGVQLFMWNWKSIAEECKTELGPAGYDWALVMPPQEHNVGPEWWQQYQPVSYKIESRLGTREDFASMVKSCQQSGVKIIADAVINHMFGFRTAQGWLGGNYTKYNIPDLYSSDDFHPQRREISDWNDVEQVQNHELLGLSDLATEKPNVRKAIAAYLNDLLSLGVYGFRIDAARHIPATDLKEIKALLSTDAYFLNEVAAKSNPEISDYFPVGDVWEFDWVDMMQNTFGFSSRADSLPTLIKGGTLLPSQNVVTMVSNHDTERDGSALNYKNASRFALANIFTMATSYGKPMVYSGYAFDNFDLSPKLDKSGAVVKATCPKTSALPRASYANRSFVCQHRWKSIESMIAWRDAVGTSPETELRSSKGILSIGRGGLGHVAINSTNKTKALKIKTKMPAGKYCDLISGGRNSNIFPRKCLGATVDVDRAGVMSVSTKKLTAVAISIDSKRRF